MAGDSEAPRAWLLQGLQVFPQLGLATPGGAGVPNHTIIPRKPRDVDWDRVDALKAQGFKQKEIAPQLGLSESWFSILLKRRREVVPTNGDAEAPAPVNGNLPAIPTAHPIASERISAFPAHSDASELDDLKARVATLEAFIKAVHEGYPASASQRTDSASAHQDAFQRIHDALARLDARLHVVETSLPPEPQANALPAHQNAPAHFIAPERTEPPTWKSQGQQFAADMLEWVDAYARQTRREKREIVDLALRTLRGLVEGKAVRDA
jgi:hypothetical protein